MADSKNSILKMHDLRPAEGSTKNKKRLGRGNGSGQGTYAGRGRKGTKKRNTVHPWFEGGQMPLHMRLPKLRGFKNPFRVEYQPVNVADIAEVFKQGGKITVADLVEAGLVRKNQPVKVLGTGEISIKVDIEANAWSSSAQEKIEAAGGTITKIEE